VKTTIKLRSQNLALYALVSAQSKYGVLITFLKMKPIDFCKVSKHSFLHARLTINGFFAKNLPLKLPILFLTKTELSKKCL